MLKLKRKEEFKLAFEKKDLDNFFSRLSKLDIITLAEELNLYALSNEEYQSLSKEKKAMYKALKIYLEKQK